MDYLAVRDMSTSTCALKGGVVDCNNGDTGSCGNACCALDVFSHASPEDVYNSLVTFLSKGGDGAYAYVPGEMPHDCA